MFFEKLKKLFRVLWVRQYRKALFHYGVAASTEHETLLHNLETIGINCFVDVGSNRGQFSLTARHHFPNAAIHCFEPLEEPADILRRIFLLDTKVKIHITAIGAQTQQSTIHISKKDDSSSILPISDLQTSVFPGTEERETRQVAVQPLNSILGTTDIASPAFLKVDVQGFENDVLKGSSSLLSLFDYVYIECSFIPLYLGQALAGEIINLLHDYGFSLTGVYNLFYDNDGKAVQGDFLFMRSEK